MRLSTNPITLTVAHIFALACLMSSFTAITAQAETSLEFEWDPYYSNAGFYIGLTEKPIPEITDDNEVRVYERMLENLKIFD